LLKRVVRGPETETKPTKKMQTRNARRNLSTRSFGRTRSVSTVERRDTHHHTVPKATATKMTNLVPVMPRASRSSRRT
jgi:hypothetical protein